MKKAILLATLFGFILSNSFAQIDGENIFNDELVHEVRITFSTDNYWDTLEYHYSQYLDFGAEKQYMLSQIEIDGEVIDSVGFRQKGYFSNWGAGESLKKPFKIDFNEFVPGQRFDGLKKLNLQNGFQDPTMMRDVMSYKFMRENGIKAPRTSFTRLYLNEQFWGVYILVEQVDDKFLGIHFDDNNGNLFKCVNNSNLDWQGTDVDQYTDEFELKTNEIENDWSKFLDFVETSNLSQENFDQNISDHFNIQEYVKVLAADVMMNNWDSYYDHGRNFYLYHDIQTDRINWIPWDYNLSFSTSTTPVWIEYDNQGWIEPKPLVIHLMESEEYRNDYFNALCEIINSGYIEDQYENDIGIYQKLITLDLQADTNKFYSFEDFEMALYEDTFIEVEFDGFPFDELHKGLAPYLSERSEEVIDEIEMHGYSCNAISVNESEKFQINLWPNPSDGQLNIQFSSVPDQMAVFNDLGQNVIQFPVQMSQSINLDLSHLSAGVYLVQASFGSEIECLRFVME